MKNKYRNPWHKLTIRTSAPWYENDAKQVGEHRGVKVYKLWEKAYDFVLGDCCITQRAGITNYKHEIDEILDGRTPVDTEVEKHLKANGFAALSYEEYSANWQFYDNQHKALANG